MQNISLYDYLKSFIDDEEFIEEFSFLWLYYGLTPKEKLDRQDIGISLSQLYIGLDCKTTEVGITKSHYLIKEVDNETAYENALNGNYSKTMYGLTSYDKVDPDLNKDVGVFVVVIGDHIKNWQEYKSVEYKNKKKEVTQELLEVVYKYFPQAKDHIRVLEIGTPHTMKCYINNSEGAVYGWDQNVKQGGFNRLSNKSDFSNVFLAGAWTNPGGGFEGAITGGVLTAERILKEENTAKKYIKDDSGDLIEADMPLK